MKIKSILILFAIFFSGILSGQNWRQMNSVEDVCNAYPEKMKSIFENLNMEYPGLEKSKIALKEGNLEVACGLLLDYYKNSPAAKRQIKEQPPASLKTSSSADSIVADIYTFQNISGQGPRMSDGHLKWSHNGPEDDIEWAWALNRHYPVAYLLPEYYETGNPEYLKYIDSFIKDWIIQSWPYPGVKSNTAMWRGLEVSFREKVWAQVFYQFINSEYISDATRLLILSSLPDHADYARRFHAQNNWLTMEMSGLATVAAYWPEFENSKEWLEYSIVTMSESMKEQVYPDGAQTELTSSYHFVALNNFNQLNEIGKKAGFELPELYMKTIENMWNYLATTVRPDGYGILNNDADLVYNREMILKAAEEFHREDWKYMASNGKSGNKPVIGPSFIFPWAGQMISRSGYDKDAQWSFFDFGPWGSGHQHSDKLHLSISAFGRDLLVDAGRFAYRGEVADKFRRYATGSYGHNILLIDGKGQVPGPKLAEFPVSEKNYLITSEYDLASGSFNDYNDLEGKVKHTRTVYYLRGNFWVVIDRLETDRPRKIEALWHFHPDCLVDRKGEVVATNNARGNLQILPAGNQNWKVEMIKGQEKPEIQGWYSPEYNKYEPNTTAIYSTEIQDDNEFIWVLFPSEKVTTVVKAELISKNNSEIKVKVTDSQNHEWEVTIPL